MMMGIRYGSKEAMEKMGSKGKGKMKGTTKKDTEDKAKKIKEKAEKEAKEKKEKDEKKAKEMKEKAEKETKEKKEMYERLREGIN